MYTVDLDPDTAKSLAASAAYAVMLDVPQGTMVGVDQKAFAVGPKFKGLKMVPPGVHFFSWQAAGPGNQFAPTVSCFVHLEAQRAHVWRWDASAEVAVAVADDDEVCASAWRSMPACRLEPPFRGQHPACLPAPWGHGRCSASPQRPGALSWTPTWRRTRWGSGPPGAACPPTSRRPWRSAWSR